MSPLPDPPLVTTLERVLLATRGSLGPQNTATGIYKRETDAVVNVTDTGLAGDFQADRRVHGGLEKAIHHYAAENYALLQQALPHLADALVPATIGENFSTHHLTEENVHIGDTFRVGSCLLQVSQPRRPCWKINHRYGNAYLSAFIMAEGISGWYYRVLQTGAVQAGDQIERVDRMQHSVSIRQMWRWFMDCVEQRRSASEVPPVPGLSNEWQWT